jgi:hypothetical protein
MELLCDSDHERLEKIRKAVVAASTNKSFLSPNSLAWLDDAMFLLACLEEARSYIWANEY